MQFFIGKPISETEAQLSEEESWHCIKVLRHKRGDAVNMLDGLGTMYICTLIQDHPKKCLLRIESKELKYPVKPYHLHLAIAPTKNIERIEWMVEKAVEIGINELTFLNCNNSERKQIKTERIEKIIHSACKQSMQFHFPKLNDLVDFNKFIFMEFSGFSKFIAHCQTPELVLFSERVNASSNVLCLVGPEGDFTITEVNDAKAKGFEEVSLGTSRLRTETAGLYICNTLAVLSDLN